MGDLPETMMKMGNFPGSMISDVCDIYIENVSFPTFETDTFASFTSTLSEFSEIYSFPFTEFYILRILFIRITKRRSNLLQIGD